MLKVLKPLPTTTISPLKELIQKKGLERCFISAKNPDDTPPYSFLNECDIEPPSLDLAAESKEEPKRIFSITATMVDGRFKSNHQCQIPHLPDRKYSPSANNRSSLVLSSPSGKEVTIPANLCHYAHPEMHKKYASPMPSLSVCELVLLGDITSNFKENNTLKSPLETKTKLTDWFSYVRKNGTNPNGNEAGRMVYTAPLQVPNRSFHGKTVLTPASDSEFRHYTFANIQKDKYKELCQEVSNRLLVLKNGHLLVGKFSEMGVQEYLEKENNLSGQNLTKSCSDIDEIGDKNSILVSFKPASSKVLHQLEAYKKEIQTRYKQPNYMHSIDPESDDEGSSGGDGCSVQ